MNQFTNDREAPSQSMTAPLADYGDDPYDYDEGRSALSIVEQIWTAILNHRNLAAAVVTGTLLLGLLATFLATPQYESTIRLEILQDVPVATSVDGQRDKALMNELSFYNTQYSLLESKALAERVVRAGNLLADKDFIEAFKLTSPDSAMGSDERRRLNNEAAVTLLDRLTVSPLRSSSLVDVTFATPSPRLSAKLADLWGQQFLQAGIDRRFAATSDARKYLESRLETLRQNLETSERSLINYATSKGIVTVASQTDAAGRTQSQTLVASDIAGISAALIKAR